jgi:membrane protein
VKKLSKLRIVYQLLRDTIRDCVDGDFVSQGAALSYYTFFAIAPLFILVLAIAGFWFGEEAAQKELFGQLNQLVGKDGGEAIQSLVAAANKPRTGFWAASIAVGTLVVAATSVFVQLQDSLNKIWNVRHKPGRGLRNFIRHRLLSFAMIFGIGFLLLVSLVVSAGLSAVGNFMGDVTSGKEIFLKTINFMVSLGIITVLFAMIFKFLPDVKIMWRNVWLGGFITALLFNLGKFLFGVYLGRSSVASVYGAMGSLVIVLLWVYYSALILFFGAQFTCVYARRFGVKPEPLRGAEFIPMEAKLFSRKAATK